MQRTHESNILTSNDTTGSDQVFNKRKKFQSNKRKRETKRKKRPWIECGVQLKPMAKMWIKEEDNKQNKPWGRGQF